MRMTKLKQHISALLILSTTLLLSGCPFIGFGDEGCNSSNVSSSAINSQIKHVGVSEFTQAPTIMGKIYLYQQYLLINSPYKGIYIYNNSDATQPLPLVYLDIPGNVDMAIKDGYLYVDSYSDLVTVRLVDDLGNVLIDVKNVAEVSRVGNVFPLFSRSNFGNDIRC